MPRLDLADITIILDRSGSMGAVKTEAEKGLATFVEEQKKQPGEGVFSLIQFDDQYDIVHRGISLKDAPDKYTLEPRGWTALNDAIAKTILDTGERLKALAEDQRPGLVVMVIMTDGEENRSKEFGGVAGRARVKEMIEHQEKVYGWKFTFLGANQDAFAAGESLGIARGASANYVDEKTAGGLLATSNLVGRMRGMSARGDAVKAAYTDEERKSMEK